MLHNYTEVQLASWRTGRVGGVYMGLFLLEGRIHGTEEAKRKHQLTAATRILSNRPLADRIQFYKQLVTEIEDAFNKHDDDQLARLARARDYYELHVLD